MLLGALVLFATAAAWISWTISGAPWQSLAPGAFAGRNLLLVTVDTLRADRLGIYGGSAPTPVIDALARRGVRFTRAFAHAPMTLPSHASILTGLTPPGHGVRNNGAYRLTDDRTTLAEMLKEAGYRTGAFVGAFVLDARFGLAQGFDDYDDRLPEGQPFQDFAYVERPAARVVDSALGWILGTSRQPASTPWFAWLHLFDPHAPYDAPERRTADPYDNEVAYVDAELGRLFGRLEETGLLEDLVIVFTSDHGESLGEHGEQTHGLFAYNATLAVPLILAGPGVVPAVFPTTVSHVDIAPTLADLFGAGSPSRVDGRSLRVSLNGRAAEPAAIYIEALDANLTRGWAPLTGVILDRWKMIDLPIPELYDLVDDPREQRNVASSHADTLGRLGDRLVELRERSTEGREPAAARLDDDARERLRALGYAGGSLPPGDAGRAFTPEDDPKNLVELDQMFQRALATRVVSADESLRLLREVIARRPGFTGAYTAAASLLIGTGRVREAVELIEQGLRVRPAVALIEKLGAAHVAGRDFEAAVAVLAPAAQDASASSDLLNTLGVAYSEQGLAGQAREIFERLLALDPSSASAWNNLGILELRRGNLAAAEDAFERAAAIDPTNGQAWQGLGAARAPGDLPGAVAAWRKAVEIVPHDLETLFNLGVTLARSAQPREALPFLERFRTLADARAHADDLRLVNRLIRQIEGS